MTRLAKQSQPSRAGGPVASSRPDARKVRSRPGTNAGLNLRDRRRPAIAKLETASGVPRLCTIKTAADVAAAHVSWVIDVSAARPSLVAVRRTLPLAPGARRFVPCSGAGYYVLGLLEHRAIVAIRIRQKLHGLIGHIL